MHILNSKESMLHYISGYDPPELLIDKNHRSITYTLESNSWHWAYGYLMGLSLSSLEDLCIYLEQYNDIPNPCVKQTVPKSI